MHYSNRANRGRDIRGFAALSQKIGRKIWNEITIHDEGQMSGGYGGTRTMVPGGGGGGKSTLETKFGRKTYCLQGISRKEYFDSFDELKNPDDDGEVLDWIKSFGNKIRPECILWRGREYDYWNLLAAENLKSLYPDEPVKPLRVHIHRSKDESVEPLRFNQYDPTTNEVINFQNLDVKEYRSVAELSRNLLDNGNNVIYPPLKHYMSIRLKEALNTKRNATDKRNRWGNYVDKNYLAPDTNYLVERDIFLFEIFEYLFRENSEGSTKKFYTAVIDESHDLFRANAPDIYYWIIDYMVDILIDSRKLNLSMVCFTHDRTLIDHRIYKRASHILWLPGAEIGGKTIVDPRLASKLETGQCITEALMKSEIGGMTFNPLPKELPILAVHGMTQRKSLSSTITDDEFEPIASEGGQ